MSGRIKLLAIGVLLIVSISPAFAWKCCNPLNNNFGAAGGGGDAPGIYLTENKCRDAGKSVESGLFCPWNCFANYSHNGKPATGHYWIKKSLAGNFDFTSARTDCADASKAACPSRAAEALRLAYPNNTLPQNLCGTNVAIDGNTRMWRGGTEKANAKEANCNAPAGTIVPAVYSCPQGGTVSGSNCVFPPLALIKTCPEGWMSNTNVVAGITTDGNCKRQVPGCQLTAPVPSNGTQISGYGFTWGNGVYQMSNASNGGAPLISCPKYYTVSGNNCIRASYAATLVTPARCNY